MVEAVGDLADTGEATNQRHIDSGIISPLRLYIFESLRVCETTRVFFMGVLSSLDMGLNVRQLAVTHMHLIRLLEYF